MRPLSAKYGWTDNLVATVNVLQSVQPFVVLSPFIPWKGFGTDSVLCDFIFKMVNSS